MSAYKLNFFYTLYQESGGTTGFRYNDEMLALYVELVDVTRWAEGLAAPSPILDRLGAIRAMTPRSA